MLILIVFLFVFVRFLALGGQLPFWGALVALLVAFWVAPALPNHAFVCTGTCQTCILRWIHASPFGTTGTALARKMRIVLKQFKPSFFIFTVPADGPGVFMGMGGLVRG